MRLGVILTLSFLLIAAFVALVGYLYKVTSDGVQLEITKLQRSSIFEVVGAAEMRVALLDSQVAAQQIITSRLQALVQPDHDTGPLPGLEDSIELAEDSLDEFEKRLEQSRRATAAAEELMAEKRTVGRPDDSVQAATERLLELEKGYAVYKSQMERFIHLSLYHPTEQVSEYFVDELQPRYEDDLLPLIRAYEKDAEAELAAELGAMESAHRAANRRNLIVTLVAFAAAVSLGLVIARSISRPVAVLQAAATRVGQGELGTRVNLKTRNEIGILARAFNKMVSDLESSTVSRVYLDDIIQSLSEILIVTDPQGLIQTANRKALTELGFQEDELFGQHVDLLLHDVGFATLESGEHRFRTKRGGSIPVYCSRAQLGGEKGRFEGVVLVAQNLSARRESEAQLRASLAEKEVLLREVHHRVKNNLQIVSSLLSLQDGRGTEETDTTRVLLESRNRIRSMALIHEQLYKSRDLARIDFAEYVQSLTRYLGRSYDVERRGIELRLEVEPIPLSVEQAIPCGMIINELVANGMEHAFPDEGGEIGISFRRSGGTCVLTVSDNGRGLPDSISPSTASTLGLRLVSALGKQLDAELSFRRNGGTQVEVQFDLSTASSVEAAFA